MHRSPQQIIAQLSGEGLRFRDFTLSQEVRCTAADAEWNYMDFPHLPEVHGPLRSALAHATDTSYAAINLQGLLGLTLPVCNFAYQFQPGSMTYLSTLLCFVVIVETRFEDLGSGRSRTETTYHVGSPRAFAWCFPLIRRVITRNYKFLMAGDIPMRERRSRLRARGYSFRQDREGLGWEKSLDIARSNVIPPAGGAPAASARIPVEQLRLQGETLVGEDDHAGLRLLHADGRLLVFPRLCPHEGASLDGQACAAGRVRCPWHGRVFSPLGTLDLDSPSLQKLRTPCHEVALADGILSVEPAVP
jgi:hypothetical protein